MVIMFMSMVKMERAMKVSKEQMAENRSRILSEAGRLFRQKGFDGVSVTEVMSAAGLTHGGFYGHFKSKDDLIANVILHLFAGQKEPANILASVDAYLSEPHCSDPATGCPISALAGLMRQQAPNSRAAMATVLGRQIDGFSKNMPGATDAERRRAAIGNWSAMVGALILARSIDNPSLSDEFLSLTREWIAEKNS